MTPRLRAFWAKLKARPDTEHEQAFIRLAVGIVLFFYLLPGAFTDHGSQRQADLAYLGAMFAFLAAAAGLIVSIILHPGVSPARRIIGAAIDSAATSSFMIAADIRALPLFLIYIWITLANGFRYGAAYLINSLALSLAGFAAVIAASRFWHDHVPIGLGLMLGLTVLSLYVLSLVRRMSAAVARAEAANEAKRRFISVVSHEMRTPLNAIINMADLLRDTTLSREQLDMAQTLSASSRVLLGLVEDVLDFSKIEAGRLTVEHTDFDLQALVQTTAKIFLQQAQDKALELVVIVMPDVSPALRGDPHHLRQVLINLVGNAIKFTERGSVTLHVSLVEESEQKVTLKFSVRDTGIGIPPAAQRRIFDSFAQADESTTRRFGGTGLGTTIAKQLVELMGGRMGVESAVGLGSTFWFEVELDRQAASLTPEPSELGEARVLVIGFAAQEQAELVRMLKGWRARPLVCDTVEQAIDRTLREISIAPAPSSAVLLERSAASAEERIAKLRRELQLPGLPAVIAAPRESGMPASVPGGRNRVLELPLDKRMLFNALHEVAAVEAGRSDVVVFSDYLKKRDSAKSYRILVADDNGSNRAVISKILERAGHVAELVASGEQVLDAIERERYQLIILDRNMPDMGGIQALKQLRFLRTGPERIPVIVVSADVTPEAKQECVDAGADAFLPKPIEAARLIELIADLGGREEARKAVPAVPARRPAASEAPAVLNRDTLRLLEELGSDSEFMERLIAAFVKDIQQFLRRLDQDPVSIPTGEFRALVHALKGSVSSIGADRLTQFCTRVSSMDDQLLHAESQAVARALREEFDTVNNALADYLAGRKRSAR